jgi:GRIP and coiled-coil domain-containing protein 1
MPEKKPSETASKEAQLQNVNAIIDEIINLKNILSIENAKLEHPIDIQKIFYNANSNSASETDETISMEEYEQLKNHHMQLEIENTALKVTMETQKSHIKTLKEKVKILNNNIEEHEVELKNRLMDHNSELKAEKNKWKEMVSAMELDFRSKISHLEQNLQKQRDRSLLLLEEKENEIKTIKTSFEIFIPGSNGNLLKSYDDGTVDGASTEKPRTHQHLGNILNANNGATNSNTESSFHMLHYAHELARKDLEISSLRKAKHAADTFLRQALQDKVTAQAQLHDRISDLEDEVENYKRYKSREGANMEYLKFVVLSFLTTMDQEGKKKMLNAIAAVLQFSPNEIISLNASLQRK